MNYTLKQLQIFLTVRKTKSVTKSAEELKLTQPAISIQLKNFQEQFELPLTEVIGRKIYITEFGNQVALAAEKILEQAHELTYISSTAKGNLTGKLIINSVSSGTYVLPEIIAGFMKKNPDVEIKFEFSNKEGIVTSLENNEIDFGLAYSSPENIHTENFKLFENKLSLFCSSKNYEEMNKSKKSIFDKFHYLERELGSYTRIASEMFLAKQKINPKKILEFSSNEGKKQALLAGIGFAIMPEVSVKRELKSGDIKMIKYPGLPIISSWQLIWPKGKNLSQTAVAFLDYVKKHQSEIADRILY